MKLKSLLIAGLCATALLSACAVSAHAQHSDGSVEVYTLEEAAPDFQAQEKTPLYQASAGYRPYQDFADKAVLSLIEGKDDIFFDMTSKNLISHFKKEKVQKNVKESLLPFFKDFRNFKDELDVAHTTDHWDSQGYSFYESFYTTSGETKHFLVQVVVEDGVMMIANLTPDAQTPYDTE